MSENVEVQHEYVTDASFVLRLASAFLALALRRPQIIVFLVVLVISLFAIAVNTLQDGDFGFLSVVGAVVLVLVLTVVLVPVLLRRKLKAMAPVGSRYAVGLGDTMMRVEGPLASSDIDYKAFRSVQVLRGFVFLRLRASSNYSALPLELFPGSDLDRLRAAIAHANR